LENLKILNIKNLKYMNSFKNIVETIIVNSYAKVNFFLNVIDTYKNSYHKIKSVFGEINFSDIITAKKNFSDNEIRVFDKSNTLPKDNLLVRAANKFIENIKKVPFGVDFYLKKNIPIGGGLGGGSSNAGSVLKILNWWWSTNFKEDKLEKIAAEIGSDVPFFIKGGIQTVFGVGNITKRIKIKNKIDIPMILIVPEIKISTPDAYKMLDEAMLVGETKKEAMMFKNIVNGFIDGDIKLIAHNIYNKFESVIFKKYPEFNNIKEDIINSGAIQSFMSGSGSTMVGIYESFLHLNKGYYYLKEKGYNLFIAKTI